MCVLWLISLISIGNYPPETNKQYDPDKCDDHHLDHLPPLTDIYHQCAADAFWMDKESNYFSKNFCFFFENEMNLLFCLVGWSVEFSADSAPLKEKKKNNNSNDNDNEKNDPHMLYVWIEMFILFENN